MRVAIIYQSMKPGNNPRRKKQEKHFEVSFEGTHEMQCKNLIPIANFEKNESSIYLFVKIND